MTDTAQHTPSHVVRLSDAISEPHMSATTFATPPAVTSAPETFASTDRAALAAMFWASAHTPEAKHRRALEMHEAGYTLTEIAREVGYSGKSGAQYAIRQAKAQREGVAA